MAVLVAFTSTPQQSVAAVIAGIVVVGFALWLVGNVRRARPEIGAEVELAPNRKRYFDDDELEGKRLDRVLFYALLLIGLTAVALPAYWLAEPGRQAGAITNFDKTFAKRGSQLFARTEEGGFNCAGCHGGVSGGDVPHTLTDPVTGKLRQVQWYAPSLDDVTHRMTEEQIRQVLTYGRLFSPMPAWGVEGGGPMNTQQIDNLIAYLYSVAIPKDEARKRAGDSADKELQRLQGLQSTLANAQADLTAAEAAGDKDAVADAKALVSQTQLALANRQEVSLGAALFNVNCARCHTQGWSYKEGTAPGSGAMGPPLYNVLTQFPVVDDHLAFVAEGKKFGEKYGLQGQASGRMPYFGTLLTKEQIELIVEYERRLSQQNAQSTTQPTGNAAR